MIGYPGRIPSGQNPAWEQDHIDTTPFLKSCFGNSFIYYNVYGMYIDTFLFKNKVCCPNIFWIR